MEHLSGFRRFAQVAVTALMLFAAMVAVTGCSVSSENSNESQTKAAYAKVMANVGAFCATAKPNAATRTALIESREQYVWDSVRTLEENGTTVITLAALDADITGSCPQAAQLVKTLEASDKHGLALEKQQKSAATTKPEKSKSKS